MDVTLTDPPGYLFENFDSVGAFRTEEDGHPIDSSVISMAFHWPMRPTYGSAAHDPRLCCMVKQLGIDTQRVVSMNRVKQPASRQSAKLPKTYIDSIPHRTHSK